MHLPLSPIDEVNQPPEFYLWVQDGLTLSVGLTWAAAYILYIRQGSIDKSYGMPIVALCTNVTWELVYGLIHPPAIAENVAFLPFFLIDLGILYITVIYGPREFKHSPLVQRFFPQIVLVGCIVTLVGHWTFAELFIDHQQAGYWSGYVCQNVISWSSLVQLLRRGHTNGHSITIWILRFVGTIFATAVFQWRLFHYPKDFGYVATPLASFFFISTAVFDLVYLYVFLYIRRLERQGGKNKLQ